MLEVDGRLPLEVYRKRMKKAGNLADLEKIDALLEDCAMGKDLPPNAHSPLRDVPHEDQWKEFEFKKNQLRVYYFLIPPDNNVVVLGEFKKGNKGQRETIAEFRRLKAAFKEYYVNNTSEKTWPHKH